MKERFAKWFATHGTTAVIWLHLFLGALNVDVIIRATEYSLSVVMSGVALGWCVGAIFAMWMMRHADRVIKAQHEALDGYMQLMVEHGVMQTILRHHGIQHEITYHDDRTFSVNVMSPQPPSDEVDAPPTAPTMWKPTRH